MDTILEYLPYAVTAIVFYNIGNHIATFRVMQNLIRNPDAMIEMINRLKEINQAEDIGMPEDAVEVQIEQVNGLVFAYDKVTGEFLAQAGNLHQVMTLAAKRFPGKKFWHPELTQDSQTA